MSSALAEQPPETVISEACRDPEFYAEHVLGARLWDVPRAILRALNQPRARVAIKGCHRSSKTWALGQAVPWFVHLGGRVITTAPSSPQVELIWSEIRKAYYGARIPLGGEMLTHEWKLGRDMLAWGRSTDKAERIQGANHPLQLIIADEAPGIRPVIFEGIEGIRSGGDVRVVLLGNPTIPGGPYYDAFTKERTHWQTFTISAFDTPNLAGLTLADVRRMTPEQLDERTTWPMLATGRWVKEKLESWGESDPRWQSRVLGQFPAQNPYSVFPIAWVEAASREVEAGGEKQAGIDPAGSGSDECVIVIRHGQRIIADGAWSDESGWDQCIVLLGQHGGPEAFEAVVVDADGIGYGLWKRLKELGYKAVAFHAQTTARDRERFDRAKDEAHWLLRERMEQGLIGGLVDDETRAQLSQIQWKLGPMGRTVVESKAEMRARGARSPDRAEALVYAFYPPPQELGDRFRLV